MLNGEKVDVETEVTYLAEQFNQQGNNDALIKERVKSGRSSFSEITRGRGGLTHHLHSEAPPGNRRMAMTFARLRLIVLLRCTGLDWMPFSYVLTISQNLLQSLYHA